MVHGVSVVWFPVSDMARAREFYGGTLGLEELRSEGEWAEFEANGLRIGLNARNEESCHLPMPVSHHTYVYVI